MTKDEALKLALEAMEQIKQETFHPAKVFAHSHAITALRKALAEQPSTVEGNGGKTGWPPGLLQDDCKGLSKWLSNQPDARRRVREALAEQPNTKANSAETAKQISEPVAWKHDCSALLQNDVELWVDRCPHCGKPRTTPQAQRTWVGLTDEEKILMSGYDLQYAALIGVVERALKEKNT